MTALFTLLGLHLLGLLSPGPDFAIIMKNSIMYSRRDGLATAIGITCGLMVTLSYCILGLGLAIEHSVIAFTAVKILGALYLIYIGLKSLLEKSAIQKDAAIQHQSPISFFAAWRQGFICHVLNPKAALFVLGLFTLVVKPHTPTLVQIGYGAAMVLLCVAWFALLATLVTHPKVLIRIRRIQPVIIKVMGVILILLGLKIGLLTHI